MLCCEHEGGQTTYDPNSATRAVLSWREKTKGELGPAARTVQHRSSAGGTFTCMDCRRGFQAVEQDVGVFEKGLGNLLSRSYSRHRSRRRPRIRTKLCSKRTIVPIALPPVHDPRRQGRELRSRVLYYDCLAPTDNQTCRSRPLVHFNGTGLRASNGAKVGPESLRFSPIG